MKLITKTILFYLLVSLPLLVIAAVISFYMINKAVDENLDESLWNEKRKAEALINNFTEPKSFYTGFDSLASIVPDSTGETGYQYSYVYRMDPADGEQINYRKLNSYYRSKGKNYLITILKPRLEEDDLADNLLDTLLITIAFLILSFFAINWIIAKSLWKPFYKTIRQMENYEVKNNSFEPTESSTKEFRQLNEAIKKMTNKIHADFMAQKEFTENASHESQTPLAVMKARLDLLMQSPNLKEYEMEQLQILENAVTKLSSLNKGLLLLAKIENNQFKETGEVDICPAIDKILELYSEMITSAGIRVEKKGEALKVKINPALCDILLNNLIQNAIRHNIGGGKIIIHCGHKQLVVKNSGGPLKIEASRIFERFKKNDGSAESLGLGLAIVKSIAEAGRFKVSYAYTDSFHTFSIQF